MAATLTSFQGYISNGTSGTAGTILTVTSTPTATITLGMGVTGTSVVANTHIVAFLTGTGGAGTYTVSNSQAVGTTATPSTFTGTTAAIITAADYNYIQAITSKVLGTPSGTLPTPYGYNQTLAAASTLAAGTTQITAVQWNNLRTDLLNAYTHQGSIGSLPSPSVATKAGANAGGSINASDFAKYLAIVKSINANPLAIAASGQSSLVSIVGNPTASNTTQWKTQATHTLVLTWSSANALKAFFNSGGYLTFSAGLTGYLPTDPGYAKSQDWNTLLTNLKTITFNYNSTSCNGSYNSILSTTGFYNLTTTDQTLLNKTTASPSYTPNQYDLLANVDATGKILTFTIQFQDQSTSSGHNPTYAIDEYVTGTLTSSVQAYYASGTAVAATLPTVTTNTFSAS